MQTETRQEVQTVLKQQFGFDQFRPGQERIIGHVMEDRRVLAIQPTGYGKSLLYQLPAVLLPGLTLVVSPLLALMRDQVHHLQHRFRIPAGSINSDQSDEENQAVMHAAQQGQLKILFVAPERLDNLEVLEFLKQLRVSLMVVDEAHCISTWGHDFRPSYRRILETLRMFEMREPDLRVLALTATANQQTEADIQAQLESQSQQRTVVVRSSMQRHNLQLAILKLEGLDQKLTFLESYLREKVQQNQGGLLYCATRENTEMVAQYLAKQGLPVSAYHAGLQPENKRRLQHAFVTGEAPIIAATNALGMGIDKPDIRFVIHVDTPGSITAYYQEVGRAGRDGEPADGILLFDEEDRKVQDYFIRNAQPQTNDFHMVQRTIQNHPLEKGEHPILRDIKIGTGLHPTRLNVVIAELMEQGFIEKVSVSRRQVYRDLGKTGTPDLSRYDRQHKVRNGELEAMISYGRGEPDCLMDHLCAALGDAEAQRCGRCSRCDAQQWQPSLLIGNSNNAAEWLVIRDIPLPASKYPDFNEGLAVFSPDTGTPHFGRFMRNRADRKGFNATPNMDRDLLDLVLAKAQTIQNYNKLAALVVLPGTTWKQRNSVVKALAQQLNIQLRDDLLYWRSPANHRQGQLLNNDQRRMNVKERMGADGTLQLPRDHGILLVDDYCGSMATMKEAARVLRKELGFEGAIIPFTIAKVRWKLGAPGMVMRT
jgi:ATP-dependent DNA helicase RecQ